MSKSFKHGAVKWREYDSLSHDDGLESVDVIGWYVNDNSDDEDPLSAHPAGYVLTITLGYDESGYTDYAQVVLTADELRDILAEVEKRS